MAIPGTNALIERVFSIQTSNGLIQKIDFLWTPLEQS